jgi:hypothetical protein
MKSISLFTLLLTASFVFAETHIPAGNVSGLWEGAGSPYLIEGDIAVQGTDLLTIEPGVDVIFQGYYRLLVQGQLLAVGTEEDSILFTCADTSVKWDGIDFVDLNLNAMDSSRLEYCEISYGIAGRMIGGVDFGNGGCLFIKNSSKLIINFNIFHHNCTKDTVGADGRDGLGGTPNGSPGSPGEEVHNGKGGAIFCFESNVAFIHNKFFHNHTGEASGGDGGDGGWAYNSQGSANAGAGGIGGSGYSGDGGSIYFYNCQQVLLYNNIF